MSTDVRCRIYEGVCPPARRNVLFSAENDYTPKRFSLLRHIVCPSDEISLNHQWPELDCLAVAAEIAEIMQLAPYRPLAHDVIAPVTMHLEDKLAIYA
jgi:hypothetical protein